MDKKNQPSKHKLKKAREEGQVSKSQDLLKLAGLAITFEIANLFYQPLLQSINHLFSLPSSLFHLPFDQALEQVSHYAIILGLSICLTAMMIMSIVKIIMTWTQTGFVFSVTPIKPSLNRLSPAKQLEQIFTLNKLWDVFAAIFKLSVILGLGALIYQSIFKDLLSISQVQNHLIWPALNHICLTFERSLLVLLIAIAMLDVFMQGYFYKRRLKMTDEEVKQEKKNRDGDPHIKSKRRSLAQQFLMEPAQATMESVKQADAVVVNPTHVAVALSYDPNKVPLPVVLYKAKDEKAIDTINYAKENDVPVVRYLWLARTLFSDCEAGKAIPRETIQAAAALFRVIKQLKDQEIDSSNFDNGVFVMKPEET